MRLFAALAVLLAALSVEAPAADVSAATPARTAFQARCEDGLGEAVTVIASAQHGFRIDHTRSFHDLTRLKGQVRPGSWVLGLTHTDARVLVKVGGRRLRDVASGNECIAPRIEASLTYLPIVLYVSREFPRDSCAYREVLAHEMRHLRTYEDYLPKAEARVRAALEQRFNGKPLYARIDQAQALLEREIQHTWIPMMKREMGQVEQLQAGIDSPSEYARLGTVCEGEVQFLLQSSRRHS